ncbi:MAG: hypothetical protein AAB426_04445 [Myxococcota bacterium]
MIGTLMHLCDFENGDSVTRRAEIERMADVVAQSIDTGPIAPGKLLGQAPRS